MEDKMQNTDNGLQTVGSGMQPVEELSQEDELLLQQFFAVNTMEVPDNGFSRRVMRRLPQGARRMNNLWTAICWLGGLVLFLLFDGVAAVRSGVVNILGNLYGFLVSMDIHAVLQSVNLTSVLGVAAVIVGFAFIGVYNELSGSMKI